MFTMVDFITNGIHHPFGKSIFFGYPNRRTSQIPRQVEEVGNPMDPSVPVESSRGIFFRFEARE